MSRVPRVTDASSAKPATPARQASLPVGQDPQRVLRGRPAPVRRCLVGAGLADRLREVWPGLMLRKFHTDAACAAWAGKERQTASNWRNGDCGPDAASVSRAWLDWPDEMHALLTGGR